MRCIFVVFFFFAQEKGDNPVFSIIQLTPANWPPSRKKEEAQTMENLRKRVELSKLTKTQTIVPVVQNPDWHLENLEQVNNRPRLLKKVSRVLFKKMCF